VATVRLTLIGLLALAMGGQNAVVRRLAVPDLTTTVLTLTVTGLVANTTSQSVRGRRLISVLAMLGGCANGRCFVALGRLAAPLWLAAVLLVACPAGAYAATRRPNPTPGGSPRCATGSKRRRWKDWPRQPTAPSMSLYVLNASYDH
jgi:hypothetical protein